MTDPATTTHWLALAKDMDTGIETLQAKRKKLNTLIRRAQSRDVDKVSKGAKLHP